MLAFSFNSFFELRNILSPMTVSYFELAQFLKIVCQSEVVVWRFSVKMVFLEIS